MRPDALFAGRYRLERRLGVGGMSTVQLAFDTRLERYVAVKLLAEHLAEDANFVSRFRREALAAARLVHPNVVQVFDFGLDEGTAPQLHRHGVRRRPVVRRDAARAGHAPARRGGRDPRPVLPRARLRAPQRRRAPRRQARQPPAQPTRAWSSSPTSASPRPPRTPTSRRSAPCSAPRRTSRPSRPAASLPARASDLYALGVVAYQLMAGRLPYDAASLTDLARLQETGPPPRLDELEPAVPPALAAAVARALHRDPERRYADAAEMETALRDGLRGRRADRRPTRRGRSATRPPRRRC